MRTATIRDVARLAQVSIATVSRALNGSGSVTSETRARVLEAASQLHFTPSSVARSLTMRRTQTIGALLPELNGEYLSELIRGIEVAARAHELHLLVSSALGRDAAATVAALRAMSGRVDGLIVMSPHGDAGFTDDALPPGMPAVLLNSAPAASAAHPSFAVDHHGGAAAMTRHLVAQGHRSIAFIAGPADDFSAAERLRGFRDAVVQAALPEAATRVVAGDYSERSGWQAGRDIAAANERPSAVFAANDMMAVGCLAAFADAGLDVPRDIALAGFDDIPMARYMRPPLTTVRVPIAELGALALERLAADISAAAPATAHAPRRVVPADVVVRRSCASRG